MSQSELKLDKDKLCVILSIGRFISNEIVSSVPDVQESLTVALQCLEAAYGISYSDLINITPNVPNLWTSLIPLTGNMGVAEAEKDRGNKLMNMGNFQEALICYTRAIELHSTNPVYYCNRAAAYSRMENFKSSVDDCETAVRLDPNYSKAYGRLGLAYMSLNLHDEAVEAYGNALRLDPSNEMYKQNFEIAMDRLQNRHGRGSRQPVPEQHENPMNTTNVRTAINHIVNNPNLLNMASEMLNDETVRNAMTGLIQLRATNSGNPSMDSLLNMGQQLAQQMQQQHPDFIENLRRQFSDNANGTSGQNDQRNSTPGNASNDTRGGVPNTAQGETHKDTQKNA